MIINKSTKIIFQIYVLTFLKLEIGLNSIRGARGSVWAFRPVKYSNAMLTEKLRNIFQTFLLANAKIIPPLRLSFSDFMINYGNYENCFDKIVTEIFTTIKFLCRGGNVKG